MAETGPFPGDPKARRTASLRDRSSAGGDAEAAGAAVLAALTAACWLAIYLPGAGTGLIRDDFAWIAQNPVHSFADIAAVFGRNSGFYRPLVALSFGANRSLFDLAPLGYGLTNLALALLVGVSTWRLARTLRLPPFAAAGAAALWLMNPHGISMAVLWTSGRTALLLTLFSTLAATAWLRGRTLLAALWTLLALWSKEEAVVLPFVLAGWSLIGGGGPRGVVAWVRRTAPLAAVLGVYFTMRASSGAFTPATAPPFYRFSTDWGLVTFNLFSYLDRSASYAIAMALLSAGLARSWPALDDRRRSLMRMGLLWVAAGLALTVWIPVRSSLYACFPSVGAVLAAAAWIAGVVERRPVRLVPAGAFVCVVALASTPIYWHRNERWLQPARVSTAVVRQLPGLMAGTPAGVALVIRDGPDRRGNVAAAFGALLPEAVRLVTGRADIAVWLEPPPGDWQLAGWQRPAADGPTVTVALDGLVLRPTPAPH